MAEAKKKANSQQSTADSKTEKKPVSIKSKVKTKATEKGVKDGDTKKTSKAAAKTGQKPEVAKEAVSEQLTADSQKAEVKSQDSSPATHDSGDKAATAKAGKRSEKALKEAEAKHAKEVRKSESRKSKVEEAAKPKVQQKPARSKLERSGKKFRKAAELIEKDKVYTTKEAVELAVKTSPVKFDATVELHVRLGVDPRQADQNIRDMVVLPAGTGKTVRVAVFADPDGAAAAKKAGADIAAGDEFLQQLDKGTIDFDILIAMPSTMAKLGKYARVLGPKGLMPNPKSGTVSTDVAKAVKEAKAGRVEYRVDTTGIVHVGIGKVSFGGDKLLQNAQAVLNSIKHNKPAGLKANYVRSLYVTTSMGPSIPINVSEV